VLDVACPFCDSSLYDKPVCDNALCGNALCDNALCDNALTDNAQHATDRLHPAMVFRQCNLHIRELNQ
jgi:hypothetical protein